MVFMGTPVYWQSWFEVKDIRLVVALSTGSRRSLTRSRAGRNDREHDMRWMSGVVVHLLARDQKLAVLSKLAAGIGIPIVFRKIAAGDFNPNPVSLQEEITRRP